MRKGIVLLSFMIFIFFEVSADVFPRYNKAGYLPSSPKSCVIMADEDLNGIAWSIKDRDKKVVMDGVFGKSISGKGTHAPKPFNYILEFTKLKQVGNYKVDIGELKSFSFEVKANAYGFIVPEMVGFLKKQRSGVAVPPANEIGHTGDVKCQVFEREGKSNKSWKAKGEEQYVDMMGGWYDAGDYLKFTLTTAYTTYFLLRAYEEYPVTEKEARAALLEEAIWGLDYLVKTMPNENTFIIQVGSAEDHQQGNRMPYQDQLNGKRNAYSCFSTTQMGLTSAALALGANIISTSSIKGKSKLYQDKATQIYKKAFQSFGSPAWFEEGWEKFYADQSEEDNMELAAVEMYGLTQEEKYLEDAKVFANKAAAGWWSSWANMNMVSHLRLYKYAPDVTTNFLNQDLNNFNSTATQVGNIWGMPHAYTWATLYSFFGVGSAALQYTKFLEGDNRYEKLGIDVLHYTLGMNNWGVSMVISNSIPGSVKNIYSQMYKLFPTDLSPIGAIAEGPGDKKTHDELMQYFTIPTKNKFDEFNTSDVVFYDNDSDFQCMETTIAGMADGIYFFTVVNKLYSK